MHKMAVNVKKKPCLVLCCLLTFVAVAGTSQRIVPETFTVGDSLTVTCTASSIGGRFNLVGLNPTYNKVNKVELSRSTHDGSETDNKLATYNPASTIDALWKVIYGNLPSGISSNDFTMTGGKEGASGSFGQQNADSISLTLTIPSAKFTDGGMYMCRFTYTSGPDNAPMEATFTESDNATAIDPAKPTLTSKPLSGTFNEGSDISFQAIPDMIQPPISQYMTLRCSLGDHPTHPTPASSRTTSTPRTTNSGLVGRRRRRSAAVYDVTMPEKILHVTAISISRNGTPVASVTTFTQAGIEDGVKLGDVLVAGDVSKTVGELGFLQMNWTFPTSDAAGHYQCDIRAITDKGHTVDFSRSLEVKVSGVIMDDIVSELRDLKGNMTFMKAEVAAMKEKDKTMQSTISAQENKITDQRADIQNLQTDVTAMKEKDKAMQSTISSQQAAIQTLQTGVTNLRHVEHGVLDCGQNYDNNWKDGPVYNATIRDNGGFYYDTGITRHITKSFSSVYHRPPVVFLSVRFRRIGKDMNHHFGTFLSDVNTHNFTMFCGSHDNDADDHIADVEVSWISVPT